MARKGPRILDHADELADQFENDEPLMRADAVAGVNLGRRWKGLHEQASQFVASAGVDGTALAKELRQLLPLKTQSHHSVEGRCRRSNAS